MLPYNPPSNDIHLTVYAQKIDGAVVRWICVYPDSAATSASYAIAHLDNESKAILEWLGQNTDRHTDVVMVGQHGAGVPSGDKNLAYWKKKSDIFDTADNNWHIGGSAISTVKSTTDKAKKKTVTGAKHGVAALLGKADAQEVVHDTTVQKFKVTPQGHVIHDANPVTPEQKHATDQEPQQETKGPDEPLQSVVLSVNPAHNSDAGEPTTTKQSDALSFGGDDETYDDLGLDPAQLEDKPSGDGTVPDDSDPAAGPGVWASISSAASGAASAIAGALAPTATGGASDTSSSTSESIGKPTSVSGSAETPLVSAGGEESKFGSGSGSYSGSATGSTTSGDFWYEQAKDSLSTTSGGESKVGETKDAGPDHPMGTPVPPVPSGANPTPQNTPSLGTQTDQPVEPVEPAQAEDPTIGDPDETMDNVNGFAGMGSAGGPYAWKWSSYAGMTFGRGETVRVLLASADMPLQQEQRRMAAYYYAMFNRTLHYDTSQPIPGPPKDDHERRELLALVGALNEFQKRDPTQVLEFLGQMVEGVQEMGMFQKDMTEATRDLSNGVLGKHGRDSSSIPQLTVRQ